MPYVALSRKWRPQRFGEVVGQVHVVRTLENVLRTNRAHHAYLFSGPRGVGKTTMARIFAKALNCTARGDEPEPCNECESCLAISAGRSLDVVEIDAASNNGVDDIRELRENVKLGTVSSRYRVYIVDEAHMLSMQAWNAFLKTLEEPPAHVIFIFASTEKTKFPPTILSRCQQFEFRRMTYDEIVTRLRELLDSEHFDIEDEGLALIAQQSEGCLRDAQSILEQIIAYGDGKATADDVSRMLGFGSAYAMAQLTDALVERNAPRAVGAAQELTNQGADLAQCLRLLIAHFHGLMRLKVSPDLAETIQASASRTEEMLAQAEALSIERIQWALKVLMHTARDIKILGYDAYNFELAMLDICRLGDDLPLEEMLDRLETLESRIEETAIPGPQSVAASETTAAPARAMEAQAPMSDESPDRTADAGEETTAIERGAAPELTQESLDQMWRIVKERLAKDSPLLAGHLDDATPTVRGDELVLSFQSRIRLNGAKAKKPALDDAIAKVIGRAVPVVMTLDANEMNGRADVRQERTPEDEMKNREQMVLDVFTGEID